MGALEQRPPAVQALYRACIKDAAVAGAELLRSALAGALREWPGRAAATADAVERAILLEALAVLRERRQALVDAFPSLLLAEFAQAIAGERDATLGFESLPHLGEEQVLENAELVRALAELERAVRPQLGALEAVLQAAQLTAPGAAQRHPLRPEVYVRSLERLVRQCPVPAVVRRRWLRHLPPLLAPELARAYEAMAQRLQPAGAPPLPALAPPEDAAQATQLTIRELRTLLAAEPEAHGPEGGPGFADTSFAHTVPAALEMLQDLRKVDQLMQQLRQRQAAMPGRRRDSLEAFREAMRRQAKRPAQVLGLEVVQLLVAQLAADPRLLPPVRGIVRELEPPLLRLALADPRFFSDRGHPARRLLHELTQRSLAWSSAEAPGCAEFLETLQEATDALLEARSAGPEAFEIALQALREAWDEAQPRGRRIRERAMRALLHAEERNLLAERIRLEVLEHADAAGAPAEALAFLTGPWAQVMAQARLVDGSGAEDPGGHGEVVTLVLWSVQPGLAQRVAGHQRRLAQRIEQGLARIDYLPADTLRWQRLLAALHALALSAAIGTEAPEPVAPAPARVDTWLAPLEMHESGFMPDVLPSAAAALAAAAAPEPEVDALGSAELAVGTYVDLLGEGWERWQLTWTSPHGLMFMFTHAGGTTRSMTRRKLQQMLAQGTLRLVSAQPVVEGALDAVAQVAWRNTV
jgi:hypothetical protein